MSEGRTEHPIIHFVGSIPLSDAETVFRRLAETAGPYLRRLPDGETGIRKTILWYMENDAWIQGVTTGSYRQWMATQYSL